MSADLSSPALSAGARGSENSQDEMYARLRREGWSPMMGVLVLKKDGQLTLIDAAGALIVTADSPNADVSDECPPRASEREKP